MSLSHILTRPVNEGNDPADPDDNLPTRPVRGQRIPSTPLLAPVLERYEVHGELGRGGMGVVFSGYDLALKRPVAIKMILHGTLATADAQRRFQAEAEAIGRLNHPNLVQIYETGQVDGRPYAIMEYIEGGTLAEHLACRSISPDEAATIVAELAEGIDFAHQKGVVHRDLKPANILLNGTQPKIVDFGLAKFDGSVQQTQTGDVIGTPNYMAPERITDPKRACGPAVDIYALGAILFEILTGQLPFDAGSPLEVVRAVVDREVPSVRTLRPEISRDLATICQRCLQKNPQQRYTTATALAADLRRYIRREPIDARPISTAEKVWRWSRRHPALAFFLVLAVTILVGVVVVSTMTARQMGELVLESEKARHEALKKTAESEWQLYRSALLPVSSHFQLNNNSSVRQALELAPGQHRGWEWYHFAAQLDHAECIFHNSTANPENYGNPDYSSDGRVILLRGSRTMLVYDARTYQRLDTITAPTELYTCQLSPSGEHIRVLFMNGQLCCYDRARRQWETLPLPARPSNATNPWVVQFASNRQQFTCYVNESNRSTVAVLAADGHVQHQYTVAEPLRSLHMTPDGKYLVGCANRGFTRWALREPTTPVHVPLHATDLVHCCLSSDGRRLAYSGSYPANQVYLWDVEKMQLVRELVFHRNTVACLVFTPDNSQLVTGSLDGSTCMWDAQTGQFHRELHGHTQSINDLRVTQDGRSVVTCSNDETIRLWDIKTGYVQATLRGHEGRVLQLSINHDGTKLASVCTDQTVRFWDLETVRRRQVLGRHDHFVYAVAVHPQQPVVASAAWDGTVREWDLNTGRELRCLPQRYPVAIAVRYDPLGQRLLSVFRDSHKPRSIIRLWNRADQPYREWSADDPDDFHESQPAFSPDGQWLAICGYSNFIELWPTSGRAGPRRYHVDARTKLPANKTTMLAWHPNSQEFVCSLTDGQLVHWRIDEPQYGTRCCASKSGCTNVLYSPDGKTILTVGDRSVYLWNATTYECQRTLAHGSVVYQAAYHPTQQRLVCACADNSIRVWDTTHYEEVAELRGHTSYVHSVAFTPSGDQLVSGSGDGTIRVWDTRPVPRFPAIYPPPHSIPSTSTPPFKP